MQKSTLFTPPQSWKGGQPFQALTGEGFAEEKTRLWLRHQLLVDQWVHKIVIGDFPGPFLL